MKRRKRQKVGRVSDDGVGMVNVVDYDDSMNTSEELPHAKVMMKNKFMFNYEKHRPLPLKPDLFFIMDSFTESSNRIEDPNQGLRIKCVKRFTPYAVVVHRIINVPFPFEEFKNLGDITVDYRLSATLYHTHTRMCIGNTFRGPLVGRNCAKLAKKDQTRVIENVEFEMPLFFYSNIVDESVVMILEVVVVLRQKSHVITEISGGWTVIRVFRETKLGKTIENIPRFIDYINDENINVSREVSMLEGTPRVLHHLSEPIEEQLNKKVGSKIMFSLFRHPALRQTKTWSFFRPNEIICQKDFIPGICHDPNKHITDLVKPKMDNLLQIHIENVRLNLPPQFEQKILTYMRDQRMKEHGEYFNFEKDVSLIKRTVRIGSHNTYTFLQDPSEATLVPFTDDDSGDVSVLKLDGIFSFNVANDDLCGIVFEIEYMFEIPLPLGAFKRSIIDKLTGSNKNKKTVPEIDFTTYAIVVGNCILFPSNCELSSDVLVEQEISTDPGLSFCGKPVFKSPIVLTDKKHVFSIEFNMLTGTKAVPSSESEQQTSSTKTMNKVQSAMSVNDFLTPAVNPVPKIELTPPPSARGAFSESSEDSPTPNISEKFEQSIKGQELDRVPSAKKVDDFVIPPTKQDTPKKQEPPKKEFSDYVLEQLSVQGSDLDNLSMIEPKEEKYEKIEIGRSRDLTKEIRKHMESLNFKLAEDVSGRKLVADGKETALDSQTQLQSHNLYINFLSFIPNKGKLQSNFKC